MFVEQLISENKLLSSLHDRVMSSPHYEKQLYNVLEKYTMDYLKESTDHSVSEEIYFSFIRSYNKDMKIFAKTGKFPLEMDENRSPLVDMNMISLLLASKASILRTSFSYQVIVRSEIFNGKLWFVYWLWTRS